MKTLQPDSKYIHPLDDLFQTEEPVRDVTEYSIMTEATLASFQAPAPSTEVEPEDVEIDKKIDQVYDAAYDTFQQQMQFAEITEPRYAARNAEVAANYLNIALNAAATKAKVRGDRKKASAFVPYASKNPNGLVVASREEILKMMSIDAETKETK